MSHHHPHQILPLLALQWPLLVCELLMFGGALFPLAIVPSFPIADATVRARAVWAIRVLSLVALLWMPVLILNQSAEMAGVPLRSAMPLIGEVIHQTHAGRIWRDRLFALIVLGAVAWLPGKSAIKLTVLLALAGLLLSLRAMASHAIDKGTVAVILYFVHEVAAAGWIGGLFGLWLGFSRMEPELAGHLLAAATPRVSRLAGLSVAVLAGSGLYQAYLELGVNFDHLVYSAYGRTLLFKLAITAAVIAIGANNRYRLVPKVAQSAAAASLRRNVAMECLMLSGVVAISAVLANTPPAH